MQAGAWHEADVKDNSNQDALFGFVRLRVEHAGLRTQFRRSMSDKWEAECIAQAEEQAVEARGGPVM